MRPCKKRNGELVRKERRESPISRLRLGLLVWLLVAFFLAPQGSEGEGFDDLVFLGPQRMFEGQSLNQVAFPLGGIGTGMGSLGGRGDVRDWEIFNRPGKGINLPLTFFCIYVKAE